MSSGKCGGAEGAPGKRPRAALARSLDQAGQETGTDQHQHRCDGDPDDAQRDLLEHAGTDPGADERLLVETGLEQERRAEGALIARQAAEESREQAAEDEVSMIDLAEEPPTPEAPELPPAPPPPPIEVEVRGFQVLSEPTFITPNIPAPGALGVFREEDFSGLGVERGRATDDSTEVDIAAAPRFTPFTVRPELKNREDVARALERLYPPLLRDSGIGGTVVVWVFIDEEGRVVRAQVNQTSNLEPLDQAALAVADVMEFSPAMNRENRVRVWIQIPITFQTR